MKRLKHITTTVYTTIVLTLIYGGLMHCAAYADQDIIFWDGLEDEGTTAHLGLLAHERISVFGLMEAGQCVVPAE